jgi:hypothetical protein
MTELHEEWIAAPIFKKKVDIVKLVDWLQHALWL